MMKLLPIYLEDLWPQHLHPTSHSLKQYWTIYNVTYRSSVPAACFLEHFAAVLYPHGIL
jgi:hypothetical protein